MPSPATDVCYWAKADPGQTRLDVCFLTQAVSTNTVAGLVAGIVKEILRGSVAAVANGVPGDGEEARAKVHADGVAAPEGVPEIGLDVDPVRACG